MDLVDEITEHAFGDLKVGDDAVFHGADGDDGAGSAAEHALGLIAHGEHFARTLADSDDRGLTKHDALPLHVDEGVGCSEVDPHVIGEKPKEPVGHFMNKIYRFGQKKLKGLRCDEVK
jgi:hypothetical protein